MDQEQVYAKLGKHAIFHTTSMGWHPEEILVNWMYKEPRGKTVAEMALKLAGQTQDPVPYVKEVSWIVGELVDGNVLVCGPNAVYSLSTGFREFCDNTQPA